MERIHFMQKDTLLCIHIPPTYALLDKVREYVKRHFVEFYYGRESIIIYPDMSGDSHALEHRLKLLKILLAQSMLPLKDREKILTLHKKTLKLEFKPTKEHKERESTTPRGIVPTIRIYRVNKSEMIIWLHEGGEMIFSALKSLFLFSLISANAEKSLLRLNTQSPSFGDSLRLLLQRKCLLGQKITLLYDENSLSEWRERRADMPYGTQEKINKIRQARKCLNLAPHELNESTLKSRYYRLAREFHPDLNTASSSEEFLHIKESYEVLKNFLHTRAKAL